MTRPALAVLESPPGDWAEFVARDPDATLYHTLPWLAVAEEAFGCERYFIEARADGGLAGVLPLVRQRTRLFGDRLVSLPYCTYGGPLARDPDVALALMDRAAELATELKVGSAGIRDRVLRDTRWSVRTDKVGFELSLPGSTELLAAAVGSKLRAQVKRVEREPVSVRVGGAELILPFYAVFAENMRDLGTPVYPRRFFETIARSLAGAFRVVVVELEGEPAAAGFLFFFRGTAEAPWAACTRPAKARSVNMRLYWEMLAASIAGGATRFDFGRSTVNSGTYRFKQQWGAVPRPLYWYRWPTAAAGPAGRGEGAMGLAARAWRHLPLWAANRLGPWLSPGLPW